MEEKQITQPPRIKNPSHNAHLPDRPLDYALPSTSSPQAPARDAAIRQGCLYIWSAGLVSVLLSGTHGRLTLLLFALGVASVIAEGVRQARTVGHHRFLIGALVGLFTLVGPAIAFLSFFASL